MIVAFLPLVWIAVCADAHPGGLRRMVGTLVERTRYRCVLVGAVFVIALLANQPHGRFWFALPAYLAAYAVLAAWLWLHAGKVAGVPLLALGVGSNLAVMALNGGMPVYAPRADVGPATVLHHAATRPSSALWWLGDTLHVPGRLFGGWYSIGDAIVLLGVGAVVWHTTKEPQTQLTG